MCRRSDSLPPALHMAKEFDIEGLWLIFDADKKGWLSLQDFQRGLQAIDHRKQLRSQLLLTAIAP